MKARRQTTSFRQNHRGDKVARQARHAPLCMHTLVPQRPRNPQPGVTADAANKDVPPLDAAVATGGHAALAALTCKWSHVRLVDAQDEVAGAFRESAELRRMARPSGDPAVVRQHIAPEAVRRAAAGLTSDGIEIPTITRATDEGASALSRLLRQIVRGVAWPVQVHTVPMLSVLMKQQGVTRAVEHIAPLVRELCRPVLQEGDASHVVERDTAGPGNSAGTLDIIGQPSPTIGSTGCSVRHNPKYHRLTATGNKPLVMVRKQRVQHGPFAFGYAQEIRRCVPVQPGPAV